MTFVAEAIVIVQETHLADIRSALIEQCEVKIKLDFVPISGGEDWGTADSLRHIRDKIKVRLHMSKVTLLGSFCIFVHYMSPSCVMPSSAHI